METSEISLHEAKLYQALEKRGAAWSTAKELAKDAGIAERTARAHLLKLAKLNLMDVVEVFPAHRYRLAEKAEKRNAGYLARLIYAVEVFGITQ